jgi:cysteinyl-tRNA synthetase
MNPSILDRIGNTPLVAIGRMNPNPRVAVLAKLEYFNPGGSVKDRPALYMIEAAERSGELTPQKIVIEATSGNTGIGLALVCAVKGYRLLLAMSESVSVERRMILKARGAEILLTPGHLGTDGAIEEVYRIAREQPGRYFVVDQFNNEANWKAHYHGTAEEIWRQTGGRVTTFVAALGTSGTLMGVSRRLKELHPAVSIVGVEPYLGHKIQGLKNLKEAYCPEIFEKHRLDKKVNVDDEDAYAVARRLAREEGLLVGMSSGAAMAAALREASLLTEGTVVVVLPDGGERYLTTPLFSLAQKLELSVFNHLSRGKEPFSPLKAGLVSVYTCGPRAARPLTLGEARRFVTADVLCGYLRWRGLGVKHVVDILDTDNGAGRSREPAGAAPPRLEPLLSDLRSLRIAPADHYPRPAGHFEEMVALGERLADKGFAYEKLRSLYFDLSKAPDYGRLSGIDTAKIRVGATVDLDEFEKLNPRDFALFKRCRLSELKRGDFLRTRWGNVRPSWHVQTAAMVMKHLGAHFDVHLSSRELVFPHHENENAIAAALTGKPLAACWVQCDRVLDDGIGVAELLNMGFSGREIRFWLMTVHYRKPARFAADRLAHARRSLTRLDRLTAGLAAVGRGQPCPELDQLIYDLKQGVCRALDDDLNLPAAIAVVFRQARRINALMSAGELDAPAAGRILSVLKDLDSLLKIFDFGPPPPADPQVQELRAAREKARAEGNWRLADRIRTELRACGLGVQDPKTGR